jgi:hypothetical protein
MPLVVRPATASDIEKFSERFKVATIRAFVADLDGEIITLGGLTRIRGRWYAFLDIKDGAFDVPGYKMALMRTAKRVMALARDLKIKFLYVQPDVDKPGAVKWLTSLGFEPCGLGSHIYRWTSCQD